MPLGWGLLAFRVAQENGLSGLSAPEAEVFPLYRCARSEPGE